MNIQQAITRLAAGEDLGEAGMDAVMRAIMAGEATAAQVGGFLVALHMKGESVEEIAAAAAVMREFALPVEVEGEHLVDIVGTGGDGSSTFNISTAAAFVVAAGGGRVAKHNNRSASGRTGSADVLEAAGIPMGLPAARVAECIRQVGVGFMFAPAHHQATRHAAGPRRELGIRTLFNLLGPLTNPARVPNQVVGVFSRNWQVPMALVLQRLESRHALVVHSEDGLDEISIAAPTQVVELRDGIIREYTIAPEHFGLARAELDTVRVENTEQSLAMLLAALENRPGPARDIVLLNAGAAIFAAGAAPGLEAGMERARTALESGAARRKLDDLAALCAGFAEN